MRESFPDLTLGVDDLLLLESFQVADLERRLPGPDVGQVLRAHPVVARYLRRANPGSAAWLEACLAAATEPPTEAIEAIEQRVLWEVADLIVYNKAPHAYDALPHHEWDFQAVTQVASLEGTVVIEVGAGTGRTALTLSRRARTVFAVEPVARLRAHIRERAAAEGRSNLFVIDGMLHAIPLPSAFADVALAVRTLGWRIHEELAELERVLRPGGTVVLCTDWSYEAAETREEHATLVSPRWGYFHAPYAAHDGPRSRYHKQL
ncbi:MAG: class I SAM-dependent methyltransferase [Polyangiaceae bacterium]